MCVHECGICLSVAYVHICVCVCVCVCVTVGPCKNSMPHISVYMSLCVCVSPCTCLRAAQSRLATSLLGPALHGEKLWVHDIVVPGATSLPNTHMNKCICVLAELY